MMMNELFTESEIEAPFVAMRKHDVQYLLLRNIEKELPHNLCRTKDVDILIHPSSTLSAHLALKASGWRQIRHPWDFEANFVFLYSMVPFRMYDKGGLHLDVAFQLACRSPNQGEWTPLDQAIQDSAWANRREESDCVWRYRLGYEDEAIHLLTRCIFDKKQFSDGYCQRLDELLRMLNVDDFRHRLGLIFFRFTPVLEAMLHAQLYDEIRQRYLQFSDY